MVVRRLLHYIIALYTWYARHAFNEMFPEYADDVDNNNVEDNNEDDEDMDNNSP